MGDAADTRIEVSPAALVGRARELARSGAVLGWV